MRINHLTLLFCHQKKWIMQRIQDRWVSVRCIGQAIDSLKWICCLTNLPLWGFSPKVRYPNRNFVAKNWTSQRGARGVVHGKSIFYYFSIGMYRKTLKNGVFGLKYDLDHPKSIFYRKQSTLCTYRNLFNHISGHFIFWPTIPGRRRGHFRGWFRQKTAFLGECETWMTLNRFSNTNKWLCELVRAY